METNQLGSKARYLLSSNTDEWLISCLKSIKQSFINTVINARAQTNPILREAERNFTRNKAKNESLNAIHFQTLTKNQHSEAVMHSRVPPSSHNATATTTSTDCGGFKTGKAGEIQGTSVEGVLPEELRRSDRCARGSRRWWRTSETGSRIPDSNWTTGHQTMYNECARNAAHNRTPREGIKSLLKHSIRMSILSSKACEESNYSGPSHANNISLENLLLDLLKHQIDAIDVTLSAELVETCQILLNGLMSISQILNGLETSSRNRSARRKTYRIKNMIAQITEAIQLESTIIHEIGARHKNQFMKLQLQALLACTVEPGTFIFSTALKSTILLAENLLQDIIKIPLSKLHWEDGKHPLRQTYWSIMQQIYSEPSEMPVLKIRTKSGSPPRNVNFEDLFDKENPSVLSFLNIAASGFGNTEHEDAFPTSRQYTESEVQAPDPKNTNPTSGFRSSTNNDSSRTNPDGSDGRSYFRRRHRRPVDLLLDMTNHVLQLNNHKYTLINKRISRNSSAARGLMLPYKPDEYLLLNVLKHQIGVLDIILTSELYDTAGILIQGILDTVNAILTVRKLSSNLSKNGISTEAAEERAGELGGNSEYILLAIEIYWTTMQTRNAKRLKYSLIKVQLDGLLLTNCSIDQTLFQLHLEQLRDECKVLSIELQQNWWTKYFSLNWDVALPEEEKLCSAYWNLMETSFTECGMH